MYILVVFIAPNQSASHLNLFEVRIIHVLCFDKDKILIYKNLANKSWCSIEKGSKNELILIYLLYLLLLIYSNNTESSWNINFSKNNALHFARLLNAKNRRLYVLQSQLSQTMLQQYSGREWKPASGLMMIPPEALALMMTMSGNE